MLGANDNSGGGFGMGLGGGEQGNEGFGPGSGGTVGSDGPGGGNDYGGGLPGGGGNVAGPGRTGPGYGIGMGGGILGNDGFGPGSGGKAGYGSGWDGSNTDNAPADDGWSVKSIVDGIAKKASEFGFRTVGGGILGGVLKAATGLTTGPLGMAISLGAGYVAKNAVEGMEIGEPDFEKSQQDAFAQRDPTVEEPHKNVGTSYYKHAIGNKMPTAPAAPKNSGYVSNYA